MKYIIVAGLLWFVSMGTFAQSAAEYTFDYASASYPAVSGTVTTALGAGSDEGISPAVPIGFTFTYCGVAYTTVKISSNGFINPGGNLTQASFSNDLAGATRPVIAPLWDDLATGATGSVVYITEGTSPNRVFIVEFRKMKWFYSATTENRNFQVRLYETSNVIEFFYDIQDNPVNNPLASVGISDVIGGVNHFASISPAAIPTMSTTVSNNAISSQQYLNGMRFRFSPATCAAPYGFTASGITQTSASLTWSVSAPVTHLKYHVIPFNPLTQGFLVPNLTTFYNPTSLTSNTTYYIYLQSDCGGTQSSWAGPFTFKTLCENETVFPYSEGINSTTIPSCWTETMVQQTGGTAPDWTYVTAGTLPTVTPFEGTAMASFNSYFCQTGSMARLSSHFLNLAAVPSPVVMYQMYHDIGFSGSTAEGVQVQVSLDGVSWINVGPVNYRYDGTTGWKEAIVDLSPYAGQTIRIGFLGISQYGNNMFIDDVFVGDQPGCMPPNLLSLTGVTANTADITWQAGMGNVDWNYELGTPGFTPGTGTEITAGLASTNSVQLNGLNASMSYEFYVSAGCDTAGSSSWTGPLFFTTSCLPITSLPLDETFENAGGLPACWSVSNQGGVPAMYNWEILQTDPNGPPSGYGGSGYFAGLDCFNAPVNGNAYYLTTVPIFISSPVYSLSYYYWIGSGYGASIPLVVSISNDNGMTWVQMAVHNTSITDSWVQNTISLQSFDQDYIIIRFDGYSDYGFGGNNIGVDQMEIKTDLQIVFSGFAFNEESTNTGSIVNTINLTLAGDTFALTGVLTEGIHYTTANVPAGLTPVVEVLTTNTATFSLTGNALLHGSANDEDSLELTFLDGAFISNNAALLSGSSVDTFKVNFLDMLIINEIDADQNGSDLLEFVELFDGGTGNTPLDSYCMVFYNGSNDLVYGAWDLDGHSTDAFGYFVIGTPTLGVADMVIPGNSLQNGQDAVAVYLGSASSFPAGSAFNPHNVIDAVVYDNGQADDPTLLSLLVAGQPQVNENEYSMGPVYSLQRIPNGSGGMLYTYTYTVAPPTPGTENLPAPRLDWPTDTFMESLLNDGSIETIITLELTNDQFALSGSLTENVHFTSLNVPPGLAVQSEILNDSTLQVSLSGMALYHDLDSSIGNMEVHFEDVVFTGYSSDLIIYANRQDLNVQFVDLTSVLLNSEENWEIFPNPAVEYFNLYCPSCVDEILTISDISGRVVLSAKIKETNGIVNVSGIENGAYLIRVGDVQKILIIAGD